MLALISRIISSGAPRSDVNMLTGSSDADKLLANISAIVMMMAPASPLDMYVNLSLRLVSNLAM